MKKKCFACLQSLYFYMHVWSCVVLMYCTFESSFTGFGIRCLHLWFSKVCKCWFEFCTYTESAWWKISENVNLFWSSRFEKGYGLLQKPKCGCVQRSLTNWHFLEANIFTGHQNCNVNFAANTCGWLSSLKPDSWGLVRKKACHFTKVLCGAPHVIVRWVSCVWHVRLDELCVITSARNNQMLFFGLQNTRCVYLQCGATAGYICFRTIPRIVCLLYISMHLSVCS